MNSKSTINKIQKSQNFALIIVHFILNFCNELSKSTQTPFDFRPILFSGLGFVSGFILAVFSVVFLHIFVQKKTKEDGNNKDEQKNEIKTWKMIFSIFLFFAVILSMTILSTLLKIENGKYLRMLYPLILTILIGILMPIIVITRNSNMKKYVKRYIPWFLRGDNIVHVLE